MPSPAWGPSSDLYFNTLQPLEKTFTMVYLDTRASGRSQPAKSTKEYTWDHLVADIEALRAHLKQDKVWLMGHSEGGEQVLFYVVKHPERVRGLLLLATRAVMDAKQRADIQQRILNRKNEAWFDKYQEAEKKVPANDEEYAEKMRALAPMKFARPERMAKLREAAKGNPRPYSLEAGKGSVDSGRDQDYDLTGRLKKVTVPALIVVGAADVSYSPLAAQRMHWVLPNSKMLLIEDAGHFPWLEQPNSFFDGMSAFLESFGLKR
jgi:proline-specific peptidase